jgi:hypothetical protein
VFIGAIGAAMACVAPAATLPTVAGAEYAIRWNPRDGGPATAAETLALLGLRAKHSARFSVDYYDLPPAATAPPGFATILRQRVDAAGHAAVTWKLRGDQALSRWVCPLRDARDVKAEVDVGFDGVDTVTRRYSYSCTSDDLDAASSLLFARANGCPAAVTRKDAARVRVEEWRLPGGAVLLEVSGSGADTSAALARFRLQVVVPLLAAGIRPSPASKTDQVSRC